MKVWKLPSNRTTSRTGLVSVTTSFVWEAFQKSGRSNVTTGGALCLEAIMQLYCSVDKVHVLSLGYMSTIGRKASGLFWVLTVLLKYMHDSSPIWYTLSCKAKGHLVVPDALWI